MASPYIVGVGNTAFGVHAGVGVLDLMAEAASNALQDAARSRQEIDGVLCGYATTLPHLMLSTLFCERFAVRPAYAHGMQLGGATGAAMLALATDLVRVGRCRNVLVVAGENRASGQSRDASIQTLSQVGDPTHELPNGMSVPACYALLASRYLHETGATEADLAELAVAMRANASRHPDAHLRTRITVDEVMASKPIAAPLKLLDCCPISDGAVALVVSSDPGDGARVVVRGCGQAHLHQHLTGLDSLFACGASAAAGRAFAESGLSLADIDYLAVYDSFTITLAMLLEEIGFAPRGRAAHAMREGVFSPEGRLPLNTHGGLLSFGHSGVAGGMAHAAEAVRQLAGRAGDRQVRASTAYLHGDGGVMSSHVSLVLAREA